MIEHVLPQAVQDDYVARLRTLAARYDRQLAALRTREDAMNIPIRRGEEVLVAFHFYRSFTTRMPSGA